MFVGPLIKLAHSTHVHVSISLLVDFLFLFLPCRVQVLVRINALQYFLLHRRWDLRSLAVDPGVKAPIRCVMIFSRTQVQPLAGAVGAGDWRMPRIDFAYEVAFVRIGLDSRCDSSSRAMNGSTASLNKMAAPAPTYSFRTKVMCSNRMNAIALKRC